MRRTPSPPPRPLTAVQALTEAQRIAFAPLTFHAAKSLRDLGILQALADAGETGLTLAQLEALLQVSAYGLSVLLDMGAAMNLVDLQENQTFILGKVGYALLFDEMTRVNFDFAADVCYQGAAALTESIRTGKPAGLQHFGPWPTIYEGLAHLPAPTQKSWFAFDHYYSDAAFPHALPVVFAHKPRHLLDLGGNTAKWALACHAYDPQVQVTIVDLPGQLDVARGHIARAQAAERIHTHAANLLDPQEKLPTGADAVWMSQFLDCFAPLEITSIAQRVAAAIDGTARVFVQEPLWDHQRFGGAAYALHATSLYFTCMANGNSRMYAQAELVAAVQAGGLRLENGTHNLGPHDYSLLCFQKVV